MKWIGSALVALVVCFGVDSTSAQTQLDIPRVSRMPDTPEPYRLKDWKKVARDYDRFVFDPTIKGEYLPLLWWDDTKRNFPRRAFGLPTYVLYRDGEEVERLTGDPSRADIEAAVRSLVEGGE